VAREKAQLLLHAARARHLADALAGLQSSALDPPGG
jgi:hypothetical protein